MPKNPPYRAREGGRATASRSASRELDAPSRLPVRMRQDSAFRSASFTTALLLPWSSSAAARSGSIMKFIRTFLSFAGRAGRPRFAFLAKASSSSRTSPSDPMYGSALVIYPYLSCIGLPKADDPHVPAAPTPRHHAEPRIEWDQADIANFTILIAAVFDGQGLGPISVLKIGEIEASLAQGLQSLLLVPFCVHLGSVDKKDSQGGLIVIQADICDGDQLGTRPDVGRGVGVL